MCRQQLREGASGSAFAEGGQVMAVSQGCCPQVLHCSLHPEEVGASRGRSGWSECLTRGESSLTQAEKVPVYTMKLISGLSPTLLACLSFV